MFRVRFRVRSWGTLTASESAVPCLLPSPQLGYPDTAHRTPHTDAVVAERGDDLVAGQVATADDVAVALTFANTHNISISVKTSGHSYTGSSTARCNVHHCPVAAIVALLGRSPSAARPGVVPRTRLRTDIKHSVRLTLSTC